MFHDEVLIFLCSPFLVFTFSPLLLGVSKFTFYFDSLLSLLRICRTVGWIRSFRQCEEVKWLRISSWDTRASQWRLSVRPCLQCFKRPLDEWQALPQMLSGVSDGCFSLCCFSRPVSRGLSSTPDLSVAFLFPEPWSDAEASHVTLPMWQ